MRTNDSSDWLDIGLETNLKVSLTHIKVQIIIISILILNTKLLSVLKSINKYCVYAHDYDANRSLAECKLLGTNKPFTLK